MTEPLGSAGRVASDLERSFVLALGGAALSIAGATLVAHERVPISRFNYVEVHGVSPERQTGFFERALDFYFQRALRPTFRLPIPEPAHLVRVLRGFAFEPAHEPVRVLAAELAGQAPARTAAEPPSTPDLAALADLWADERERPELRAALDVAVRFPNPAEELVPVVVRQSGSAIAAAAVFRDRDVGAIFGVTTQSEHRGRGTATALVESIVRSSPVGPVRQLVMWADSERLATRLGRLGFSEVARFRPFELPLEASFPIPAPGPATPPRWRPPRPRSDRQPR